MLKYTQLSPTEATDNKELDRKTLNKVKENRPKKLPLIQKFGTTGNCNTTLKAAAWALYHSGLSEDETREWLTRKYRQQYDSNTTIRDVLHAMDGIYSGNTHPKATVKTEEFHYPKFSHLKPGEAEKNATDLGIEKGEQLLDSPDIVPENIPDFLKGAFAHAPIEGRPTEEQLIYIGSKYNGNIHPLSKWTTAPKPDEVHPEGGMNRDQWLKNEQPDQIIMNRMAKLHDGSTSSGGRSKDHCIKVPEVLTYEADGLSHTWQLGVINYLATILPLITVVDSGNKSFHATFSVRGLSEEQIQMLALLMHHLGADSSVLRHYQLSRLGCAKRKFGGHKGAYQACLYMDSKARAEKPDPKKIHEIFERAGLTISEHPRTTNPPADVAVYYYPAKRLYPIIRGNQVIALPLGRTRAHLRDMGFLPGDKSLKIPSEIDPLIIKAERDCVVQYCGPLAGHPVGYYSRKGVSYISIQGPIFINPEQGNWDTILNWLTSMLSPETWDKTTGSNQYKTLLGWLQIGIDALRNQQFQVGQLLALAGESGSGKSQLQSLIITPILGGRSANPFKYLSGKTDFNANLYSAEHLTMDDEALSKKTVGRVEFGQKIKSILVAGDSGDFLHAKGVDGIDIRVQRRMSMSLNDNEADLAVLPPMNIESIADKIVLLRCAGNAIPMPTCTTDEFEAFKDQIASELPAFLWHLLNEYEIPDHLSDGRYGITSYKNPELLGRIHDDSDEAILETVLAEVIFSSKQAEWVGTTAELMDHLSHKTPLIYQGSPATSPYASVYQQMASTLIQGHPRRLSSLLKRLQTQSPGRYSVAKGAGNKQLWTIRPLK